MLALNLFSCINFFHTPPTLPPFPLIATHQEEYPTARSLLSSATYQLLGVLGPGLAGSIAAFVGIRQGVFSGWHHLFDCCYFGPITLPGQLYGRAQQPQGG